MVSNKIDVEDFVKFMFERKVVKTIDIMARYDVSRSTALSFMAYIATKYPKTFKYSRGTLTLLAEEPEDLILTLDGVKQFLKAQVSAIEEMIKRNHIEHLKKEALKTKKEKLIKEIEKLERDLTEYMARLRENINGLIKPTM